MPNWKQGDLAECIDDTPSPASTGNWRAIVRGRVYRVIGVPVLNNKTCLQLQGIHDGTRRGLLPWRFRKVEGDAGAWRQLVAKHKHQEPHHA
jgi:hypothetical protein